MGNRRLHHLAGYDIAKKIGCHYTGDVNTIDHGGAFYSIAEVEHGYFPCVRFYGETVDGASFWEAGSVPIPTLQRHVQSPSGMWSYERMTEWESAITLIEAALGQFSFYERDALMDNLVHVVFDYLLGHNGMEDDTLEWYVHEGEDAPDDGREVVRIGKDCTENQILNKALKAGGLMRTSGTSQKPRRRTQQLAPWPPT